MAFSNPRTQSICKQRDSYHKHHYKSSSHTKNKLNIEKVSIMHHNNVTYNFVIMQALGNQIKSLLGVAPTSRQANHVRRRGSLLQPATNTHTKMLARC
jgi:uncharacterized C2H2 Zn-finger protein